MSHILRCSGTDIRPHSRGRWDPDPWVAALGASNWYCSHDIRPALCQIKEDTEQTQVLCEVIYRGRILLGAGGMDNGIVCVWHPSKVGRARIALGAVFAVWWSRCRPGYGWVRFRPKKLTGSIPVDVMFFHEGNDRIDILRGYECIVNVDDDVDCLRCGFQVKKTVVECRHVVYILRRGERPCSAGKRCGCNHQWSKRVRS